MKRRRLILSGLVLLYLSILLAGCQLQGKNDPVDGNGMPDSAAVVDWSNSLSGQMPEQDDPARLVIVADANDGVFLNSTLVDFNRENPQYSVTLEMAEENSEMFRTRIMADIMAGGGPDILCVSPEDMEILAEQKEGLEGLLTYGSLDMSERNVCRWR